MIIKKLNILLASLVILLVIQGNSLSADGFLEEMSITQRMSGKLDIKAKGWAASNIANDTLVSVDIFLNGKLAVSSMVQPQARPDVVSVMGHDDWLNSGWHLDETSQEVIPGNKWKGTAKAHFSSGATVELPSIQEEWSATSSVKRIQWIFLRILCAVIAGVAAFLTIRSYRRQDKGFIGWLLCHRLVLSILAFMTAFLVFFLRRPDILLNPQFWAEDGMHWFQEALDFGGLRALLIPHTGYFQTMSRLVMGIATMLPLGYAPLFSNVIALLIRSAPVGFLFTRRMDWISWPARLLIVLYYILMPNLWEVHANISNSFWYLALYLFMTIVADSPKTTAWKVHDFLVLILAGLSSIGIFFILPCFLLKLWHQSGMDQGTGGQPINSRVRLQKTVRGLLKPYSVWYLLICLIQGLAVMTSALASRSPAPLGLSDTVAINILSARLFLGTLLPLNWVGTVWDQSFLNYTVVMFSIVAIVCLIRLRDYRVTGLAIFGGLMLLACLARPMISFVAPQLPQLRDPFCGGRYFVVPCIVWFCLLVQLGIFLRGKWKRAAYVMLGIIVIAVGAYSFKIPPLADLKFQDYVKKYNQLEPGEKIAIPINPGGNWQFVIIKK